MTKNDLIISVSRATSIRQKDVRAVIDSVLEIISDEVLSGGKVNLSGFGVFKSQKKEKRIGRNPRTNEVILIPECTVPVFKPCKTFIEEVKHED